MDFDYIIVQAGGEGTRLGDLTKNKSKAMVPVNNAPILFHLFRKYPNKKFIIIGDYKFQEFSAYLECFAPVDYLLLRSVEKGNISALGEAIAYIPEGNPFLIIWSDLILADDFDTDSLPLGCYVGVSDQFPCSWSYDHGVLEKKNTHETGVVGCFLFDCKSRLQGMPVGGSFTKYLKNSKIPLASFSVGDTKEVGSLEGIAQVDTSKENRCRPYNQMEMLEDSVVKRGLTEEAKQLIQREILWFDTVKKMGFSGSPEVLALDPLTTRRIHGDNLFLVPVPEENKKDVILQLYDKLDQLHKLQTGQVNYFDLQTEYYQKTMGRLRSIASAIPLSAEKTIQINGVSCENVLVNPQYLQAMVHKIMSPSEFGILHGDCTFTNTLVDGDHKIFFIDPRGYFGKSPLVGDVYYDWAKIYYSIQGKFDQFNVKNFTLTIQENKVDFSISPSGWEQHTPFFLQLIPNCDTYRLKLIHGIVWLSLASHCWEDFDSMCVAFYNGLFLLNQLEEGEK